MFSQNTKSFLFVVAETKAIQARSVRFGWYLGYAQSGNKIPLMFVFLSGLVLEGSGMPEGSGFESGEI